jgi:hypothetical protein
VRGLHQLGAVSWPPAARRDRCALLRGLSGLDEPLQLRLVEGAIRGRAGGRRGRGGGAGAIHPVHQLPGVPWEVGSSSSASIRSSAPSLSLSPRSRGVGEGGYRDAVEVKKRKDVVASSLLPDRPLHHRRSRFGRHRLRFVHVLEFIGQRRDPQGAEEAARHAGGSGDGEQLGDRDEGEDARRRRRSARGAATRRQRRPDAVGKEEAEVGPAGGWDEESPQSPRECSTTALQLQNAEPVAALAEAATVRT